MEIRTDWSPSKFEFGKHGASNFSERLEPSIRRDGGTPIEVYLLFSTWMSVHIPAIYVITAVVLKRKLKKVKNTSKCFFFWKFGQIGAQANMNSESLEPPTFRKDWSLPLGEMGVPRSARIHSLSSFERILPSCSIVWRRERLREKNDEDSENCLLKK